DLLRHLPPEEVERILPYVQQRDIRAGEVLFHAGDPGDALYIVADGKVAVLGPTPAGTDIDRPAIAELHPGQAFGEMALVSRGARTATIRSVTDAKLLKIDKLDFEQLVASDPQIASALERLSHGRAISNLSLGDGNPKVWADVATMSIDHLSRSEASKML